MRSTRTIAILAAAQAAACADGGGMSGVGTAATIGATSGASSTTGGQPDDDEASPTVPTSDGATTSTTGPSSGSDEATAGSSSTGMLEPPDLADGTWIFENVSDTPAMSLRVQRASLDDGTEVVGWVETLPDDIGVLNIHGANLSGPTWTTTPLTSLPDWQNTFPDMAPGGAVALLAWTGKTSENDDYDIYLAASDGSTWSTPQNVTNGFDDPATIVQSHPVVMRRATGEAIVAYTSQDPIPGNFGGPGPLTIYVTEFQIDAAPTEETAVIVPGQATCSDLVGVMSEDGIGHILVRCNPADGGILHMTDRSGEWDADELAGVGASPSLPAIAAGPDGEVYAVWTQSEACGVGTCKEVIFAATTDHVFGSPMVVTDTANLDEFSPTVGVDQWGRVLVLSHVRVDNIVDIYLAVSEDGETFGPSERITPNDKPDDFQNPRDVLFGPDGAPSFAFEYQFDGTTPLNIDIQVARFIPN